MSVEKNSLEKDIESMLEDVMKEEDFIDGCPIDERSEYNDRMSTACDRDGVSSFNFEEALYRREKKANTTKIPVTYPSVISDYDGLFDNKNNINHKIISLDNERSQKKAKTMQSHITTRQPLYHNAFSAIIFEDEEEYSLIRDPYVNSNPELLFNRIDTYDGYRSAFSINYSPNYKIVDPESLVEKTLKTNDKIDEEAYNKLKGMFYQIVLTYNGSKIFQKLFKKTNKDILSRILFELAPVLAQLIIHQYANYFAQKLFCYLSTNDRLFFLKQLWPYFMDISKSNVGTYPMQYFVEQISSKEEKLLLVSMMDSVNLLEMCMDSQAVHVIEKFLVCIEETYIPHIYALLIKNFMLLANNCNGLCAVKKIIIHSTNRSTIIQILLTLKDNFMCLIQNAYGNYTIQVALEFMKEEFLIPVIGMFQSKYVELSLHKYSSNALEKCLEIGGEIAVNSFIAEITHNNNVLELMKNNFGNYVIQKALRLSQGNHKTMLISIIIKNIQKIGQKKLSYKWRTIIENTLKEMDYQHQGNLLYSSTREQILNNPTMTNQEYPGQNCNNFENGCNFPQGFNINCNGMNIHQTFIPNNSNYTCKYNSTYKKGSYFKK